MKKLALLWAAALLCNAAFADPPPQSGVVMRYDTYGAFIWFDFQNDWSVYLGLDLYEFCAGSIDFGTISIMEVFMKGDGHRFKNHRTGDLFATVWPGIAGPSDVCAQISSGTGQPIATGMVRIKANDNDVEPGLNPGRHNINSFGFNSNGTLYDFSTGEPLRFMSSYHAMWDGVDFATYREIFKSSLH